MANSITIKTQGLGGVLNQIKLLVPRVRQKAQDAVATAALLIESDAKQFAPVDTGRLRASIHATIAPNKLSATVSAATNYAVFIEFGTRFMAAQPFLGPAFEKNRLPFIADLRGAGLKL